MVKNTLENKCEEFSRSGVKLKKKFDLNGYAGNGLLVFYKTTEEYFTLLFIVYYELFLLLIHD